MEILYFSSKSPMVALLQTTLNGLGYDAGSVDGIFGANTLAAVKDFQKNNSITPSGVVWPQTWDKLMPYLLSHDAYTTIPYSSNVLEVNLAGLKSQYSIPHDVFGISPLGKELYKVSIGSRERVVMFNASHHANEWITSSLLMKFLFDLCRAQKEGASLYGENIPSLLSRVGLDAIVMVNPDGVDLVTGQIRANSPIYNAAKNINTDLPFPDGWKANIRGVDLNLNYPAGWERAREIKFAAGYTRPGPRDYVGAYPLCEPESAAMVELTRQNDYLLTVSLHTQGQVIYWTFEDYMPPNAFEIGNAMSEASGYPLDTPSEFSSYAGYKDWFLQTYLRPGYTPECGIGVNPLPLDQFDTIYNAVLPMLITAMKLA